MCLCMIDKRYKKGSTVIREAWKCFQHECTFEGRLRPLYQGRLRPLYRGGPLPRGEWLQADTTSQITMADPPWPTPKNCWDRWTHLLTYQAGFHVFADKDKALQCGGRVVRVFVRGIRIVGREYYKVLYCAPIGPVYVADEIFIP